jgi:GNAT superfamily N-acetyltransferase
VTVEIRRVDPHDDAALLAYVGIRCEVTPDDADSLEEVRWEDETYPGEVARFLAELDGVPVGTATTGRVHIHGPDHPRYWLGLWVRPASRRHGLGAALLRAASDAARAAGKTGFQTWVSEAQQEAVSFLGNRGFVVVSRDKIVGLDLRGIEAPAPAIPAGFSVHTLADRPDLVAGVHAAAVEAFPDIPTTDEPIEVGSLEAFVAREVERTSIPKDAFVVAVDEASGAVAGYASLKFAAGSTTMAYHDMTAVRPAFRGRGVATALKRATIAWAIGHGLEELRTGNDEDNAPMRAVNAALGYRPRPDYLELRGPLAPG